MLPWLHTSAVTLLWLVKATAMLTPPPPDEWREVRARLAASSMARGMPSTVNAAALRQMSDSLYSEYEKGVWSHETSLPEPGGVLLALPIQGQIIQELRLCGPLSHWASKLQERLMAPGDPEGVVANWLDLGASDPAVLSLAWQEASRMCNEALGTLRSGIPSAAARALWKGQCSALDIRGRVCLVTEHLPGEAGATRCVALNKQLSSCLSPDLARQLLFGKREVASDAAEVAAVSMVLEAFGSHPVYWGGPDGAGEGGLCIHGAGDVVAGARELAAGTRLFTSKGSAGLLAAAAAVIDGKAAAVDFRLTMGHTSLDGRRLRYEWLPMACSRPLVLKPCPAGLPTSLWHELMELGGGECAQISRLVGAEEGGAKGGARRQGNIPL